jgi:hypothetical protein
MDWTKYTVNSTTSDWLYVFQNLLPPPRTDKINGFHFVKSPSDFDLSDYSGVYPVGIIKNGQTVIGWTCDNSATSYLELEPWRTTPPAAFYWNNRCPRRVERFGEFINLIRGRLDMLSKMNPDVTPGKLWFEQSRHALWVCVLVTKCASIQKLVDKEIAWMHQCATSDCVAKCKNEYKLLNATREDLEGHIRSVYERGNCEMPVVIPPAFALVSHEIAKLLG